jgi:hypothetical protein
MKLVGRLARRFRLKLECKSLGASISGPFVKVKGPNLPFLLVKNMLITTDEPVNSTLSGITLGTNKSKFLSV